jgi:hypothetical protein
MNKLILLLIASFITNALFSQQGYIYKRNAFGTIDIYQSSYGTDQGAPIGTIKKNAFGYIEVETKEQKNFTQTVDPYSYRPQLVPLKPFLAPVSEIINTTNTYYQVLNQQKEIQEKRENANIKKGAEYLNSMFKPFQSKAKSLKTFLNSYTNRPDTVRQGWHNVLIISKMSDAFKNTFPQAYQDIDSIGVLGYALVEGNKIQHMLEQILDTKQYIVHSGNFVTGTINRCQTFLKEGDNIIEVLFIDYAIDPQPLKTRPHFGGAVFNYPAQQSAVMIEIYDYDNPENKNSVGVVISEKNDGMNYFASLPGKYRYTVKSISNLTSKQILSQGYFEIKDMDTQTILIK